MVRDAEVAGVFVSIVVGVSYERALSMVSASRIFDSDCLIQAYLPVVVELGIC